MRSPSSDHGLLLEYGQVREDGMRLQGLLVLDILLPLCLGLLCLRNNIRLVSFALGLDLLLILGLDERKLFDPCRTNNVVEFLGHFPHLAFCFVLLLVGLLGVFLGKSCGINESKLVLRHVLGVLAHCLEVTLLLHRLHFALDLGKLFAFAELLLSGQTTLFLSLGSSRLFGLDTALLLNLLLRETLGFLLPLFDELLTG
mmetsp:Transcript_19873/g.43346  ORF Transcript_19873/g.43346 Transcript_19873/m.43346 type:complete len:200 (+) Transcript_19873:932-1531(+)